MRFGGEARRRERDRTASRSSGIAGICGGWVWGACWIGRIWSLQRVEGAADASGASSPRSCRRELGEGSGSSVHRELERRERLRKQKPLHERHADRPHGYQVLFVLDPLGDHARAEAAGQLLDRADHGAALWVVRAAVDEAAVELEELRRRVEQHLEIRLAEADVVEGDGRAEGAQRGQRAEKRLVVPRRRVLDDLHRHARQRLEVLSLRAATQALEAVELRRTVADDVDRLIDGRDAARGEEAIERRVLHQRVSSRFTATWAISIMAFGLCRNASAPRWYDSRSISGVP